jgi:hypothetical protein
MLAKEKNLSVSICDLIMLEIQEAKKPIVGNMTLCFSHY